MTDKELQEKLEQIKKNAEENSQKLGAGLSQTQDTLQQAYDTLRQMNLEYTRIVDSLCQALSQSIADKNRDVGHAAAVRELIEDSYTDAAQLSIRDNMARHLLEMNQELIGYMQRRVDREKEFLTNMVDLANEPVVAEPKEMRESAHTTGTIDSKMLANINDSVRKIIQENYPTSEDYSRASEETMQDLREISKSAIQTQASDGWSILVEFDNGYGADISKNSTTYGHNDDLWEVAVTKDGDLCYTTPITDDVIGGCTEDDIVYWCQQIADLEPRENDIDIDSLDLDNDYPDL